MNQLLANDQFHTMVELQYYQREREKMLIEQEQLEAALYKYINLFNLTSTGYFCLNREGLIINVNQAAENLLGVQKDFLINRCFSRFLYKDSQILFSQYRQSTKNKSIPSFLKIKISKKNGPFFYARCESKSMINSDNGEEELLIIINDITENKLLS